MSVTFARLRIVGFKSFAEPVSVEILPGLTGIVGPNGCGKSNVVEALRWSMGESSARSLRGGEMDDLIFAGTAARPARNLAEVVLTLENAAGLAPPPLHEQAELQIGRRIERGAGSAYRINGREVLARTVQTLFADLATGARSSAMVSQGRVAAIVNARPEERRSVLEEAAGITGLHARRHEAELKLRATEANLARAEDLRAQLDAGALSLSAQAGEAARYRTIAAQLRQSETDLLALLHGRAARAVALTGVARVGAEADRLEAERALEIASGRERVAEGALQGPREADSVARTLLERRRIEAENAAREDARAIRESEQAQERARQASVDHDAAVARREDARTETDRLGLERARLDDAAGSLPDRVMQAEARLVQARDAMIQAERAARAALDAAADAGTRQAEHASEARGASARLDRALSGLDGMVEERRAIAAAMPDPAALQASEAACLDADTVLSAMETALDLAVDRRGRSARDADVARLASEEATRRHRVAVQADEAAGERLLRLEGEQGELQDRLGEAERNLVPEAARDAARRRVAEVEQAFSDAARVFEVADIARAEAVSARIEAEARRQDATRAWAQARDGVARAASVHARAEAQRSQLARDHEQAVAVSVPRDRLAEAAQASEAAAAGLSAIQQRLTQAEADHAVAGDVAGRLGMALASSREASGRLGAEAEGLTRSLAVSVDPDTPPDWPALGALLDVPAGLEAAIAVCLAEGLDAACVPEAPQAWLFLPDLASAALPGKAVPLSDLMPAPEQLRRALSQAGLIGAESDGDALQAVLHPGQCLVTRDGALWRWDGYRIAARQPSRAAIRLRQRARLRETMARLAETEAALPAQREATEQALVRHDELARAVQSLRHGRGPAEQALSRARAAEHRLGQQEAQTRARIDGLTRQCARAMAAEGEALEVLAQARRVVEALPAQDSLDRDLERAARTEGDAVALERSARDGRGGADAALRQARDDLAGLETRHASHELARRSLAPALARTQDEAEAARQMLNEARRGLGEVAPDAASQALRTAQADADRAADAERTARAARDAARLHAADCGRRRDGIAAALRGGQGRVAALEALLRGATAELDAAQAAADALDQASAALPDLEQARHGADHAEAALVAVRERERTEAGSLSDLVTERSLLEARLAPLGASLQDWKTRLAAAVGEAEQTERRLDVARANAAAILSGPADAGARRATIETVLGQAEAAYRDAADRLAEAEDTARRAQGDCRQAEATLSAMREAALRAEAREEQAQAILAQLLAETPEPPEVVPDDLSEAAETGLRRRVARLGREREEIGPVNLRAELELEEALARIAAIVREHEEIETAIARLRGQIGQLNREGRERLVAVFAQVDRHFQALFSRMFNGGRAHLGMVGSDDPLMAGLEIYAQPPGKKLATLSLLSGGEQALTALSLVFAVFRCNPAPVCVLDEVDAPLDDANVERFCALLGDMAREAGTRFLVVTHHQLTMAHMDRLYGVTMQERGVSRVLSVDLSAAQAMVE